MNEQATTPDEIMKGFAGRVSCTTLSVVIMMFYPTPFVIVVGIGCGLYFAITSYLIWAKYRDVIFAPVNVLAIDDNPEGEEYIPADPYGDRLLPQQGNELEQGGAAVILAAPGAPRPVQIASPEFFVAPEAVPDDYVGAWELTQGRYPADAINLWMMRANIPIQANWYRCAVAVVGGNGWKSTALHRGKDAILRPSKLADGTPSFHPISDVLVRRRLVIPKTQQGGSGYVVTQLGMTLFKYIIWVEENTTSPTYY